jgi:hypothetical protein
VNIRVEHIRLRLSGISPGEGRRLAELVGHGLSTATAGPGGGHRQNLRVAIDARPDETLHATADRIATAVARSLPGPR